MEIDELNGYSRRKKTTGKLLACFIVIMTLLTFFSNTINNFLLPRVVLESPDSGALIKEISGEGTIEAKSVYEEYADNGLKVLEVKAEEGDQVKKGQLILSLDIEELRSNLQDERSKYRQQQLELEKLKDDSALEDYKSSIESAGEKLEKQTDHYQDIKTLYDAGFESESKLKEAETEMNSAKRSYDSAVKDKADHQRSNLREIESAELELEIQGRRIADLEKKVSNGGVYTAPSDGTITELNFNKGTLTNNSQPLYKLAEASDGFQLIIPVDSDLADYVRSGDRVEVYVASLEEGSIEGSIARVKKNPGDGDLKDIVIDIMSNELQGGENGRVIISNRTEQFQALVPNSAIYTDSEGSFLFTIRRVDSPLGMESYVERISVTVLDSDNTKSAVIGISPMDKVVSGSTKQLSDGDRVVVEE